MPGGTGNVGEGIVRAFLHAGATVVVPSRSQERLDHLAELIDPQLGNRLIRLQAGYGTFAEATELAEKIVADHGRMDHAVPSIGGWWMGKALWQVSENDWQQHFVETTTSHFAVARAFVPRLDAAGSYTLIAGFAAREPYPQAGIISMHGAAMLMMREALSVDLGGRRRVNNLLLGPIINRSRPNGDPSWLTADQVGEAAVAVALAPSVQDESITLGTVEELRNELARMRA
ncbi:SDR family NAD(P)-dependent oxidoreductase [Streptomyces coffeae]|uniref:SDR family oxidoreductase n=1 Tax=Streptomyces coffeae TaxID=621382 RepID=A0ABS1NF34_9ACTN|nr:SDR family oxidoreductase [Streptomyces coffeae]MBL1098485.1 SDR family oxidoreductase [Streptomyces coffeae]